jgi:hypothetical protein
LTEKSGVYSDGVLLASTIISSAAIPCKYPSGIMITLSVYVLCDAKEYCASFLKVRPFLVKFQQRYEKRHRNYAAGGDPWTIQAVAVSADAAAAASNSPLSMTKTRGTG